MCPSMRKRDAGRERKISRERAAGQLYRGCLISVRRLARRDGVALQQAAVS